MTKQIPTSARSHQSYCKRLELDLATLEGFGRVLDVGSGLSEFVGWNLRNGLYSIGVDTGYRDLGALVGRYLHHPLPETEEGMVRKYRDTISGCSSYDSMVEALKRHKRSAASNFLQQYSEFDDCYQERDAFNLGFSDDSFDLVVNVEMLARGDYFTVQQFYEGFKEMFRVAKEVRIASRRLTSDICELPEFMKLTSGADVKVGKGLLVVTK
jgi:hypothetical protein